MLAFVASIVIGFGPGFTVIRDDYGVPKVTAVSNRMAYYGQGYAVAEDRLWQMERSRRLAEGRLAEVFGPAYVASDSATLKLGYTPAEIDGQVRSLSSDAREALQAYSDGVNAYIVEAERTATLPADYARNGFAPKPWTVHDSAAISIHLLQLFGRGGAGELRNLAMVGYLRARPNLKAKWQDVLDDLAWQQDPKAIPTLDAKDDRIQPRPVFPSPAREQTLKQLASLPAASLFELLPGIAIAEDTESKKFAENLATPFRTGSYCVVVGPQRSASGRPLLLSGPQMGFTNPSICHEIALRAPDLSVSGMDVPGVPGVLIGATPAFAWGVTSGVADVEDIFAFRAEGQDGYDDDGKLAPLERVDFEIPVKNSPSLHEIQWRTKLGPVVIRNKSGVFTLASAFRGRELSGFDRLLEMTHETTAAKLDDTVSKVPLSFNFFFAMTDGTIGWRYTGQVPVRNPALDPRLPAMGTKANRWRGFIPAAQMPHVMNPRSGLLVNWNNKPASWWPNGDTPDWGELFHNTTILDDLPKGKIATEDLEHAAFTIARTSAIWPSFAKYVRWKGGWTNSFNGRMYDGSLSAGAWQRFLVDLRKEIFLGTTGDFLSADTFALVLQPTVILRAIEGRTHYPYLHGRLLSEKLHKAITAAEIGPRYVAPAIKIATPAVPYSDRGTYIQIVELLSDGNWSARTSLPPGEAAVGPHDQDQSDLARSWTYKLSWIGR